MPMDLNDSSLYINRELSWLEFNRRCLEEAMNHKVPLLERVKFLAIACGNMDEFFMIRVQGLVQRIDVEPVSGIGPDSMIRPDVLFSRINEVVEQLMEGYERCWSTISRSLFDNGIRIWGMSSLSKEQMDAVNSYYDEKVHPLLTPLALDVSHPFPFISNNSLNFAVKLKDGNDSLHARVKIPVGILPRFVRIPSEGDGLDFVKLDDIIKANIGQLFPTMDVVGAFLFKITRNADVKVTIDEACDLMSAVETSLDSRDVGFPVRMVVEDDMPNDLVTLFGRNLKLKDYQVHRTSVGGLLLTDLWDIASLNIPRLKEEPFVAYTPRELDESPRLFDAIRERDWVLFHPYESFDTVVRFVKEASEDDAVKSIKICLYRIGKDKSIIKALMRAKEKGKAVSVLMELRAKFDEGNNIYLARELEKLGVHVVYGPLDLKVHSKLLQVIRLENGRMVRYTHLSSGNYNISTSRQYCDISFLTANQEIGEDVGELFNSLTGFFVKKQYRHLLVAPLNLKGSLLDKIRRETEVHQAQGNGYIAMKSNGLVDSDVILELYKASMAGVKIDLHIRGLCCLRPGVEGISENIRVTSTVDRFLEHSRIYYFNNGGEHEMYMGSSDLMPRNLIARVEVLYPILDKEMLKLIKRKILDVHLKDNVKTRMLMSDGSYKPVPRQPKERGVRSQKLFIDRRGAWHGRR